MGEYDPSDNVSNNLDSTGEIYPYIGDVLEDRPGVFLRRDCVHRLNLFRANESRIRYLSPASRVIGYYKAGRHD